MPPVFTAIAAAVGISTAPIVVLGMTTSAAAIVGYIGYTAVSALAMRALTPSLGVDAAAAAENKGTVVNSRSAAGPQEYVYGTVRKGGNITFIDTSGTDNTYLHMVIALAGHRVEEITSVYINDEIVTIDGSNNVTSSRWLDEDGNPTIRIKRYTGSQTAADAALAADTAATGSFIGYGIAYLYVRMKYDADVFSGGVPTFTAVVKGMRPRDPRLGYNAYSANAALCIRDYLVSSYGLDDNAVDDDYFIAAANDCDELVSYSGGTQKRYEINGVINAQSTIGNVLQDMLAACNGTLFFSGGKWKLKVGVYDASVKSFTLDDLRSEITLPTKRSRRDNYNQVVGKFINKTADYIEADYPAVTSSAFLADDNGIENTLDLTLNMVTDAAQAQRVARQTLYRNREQMVFSADFGLSAMNVEVGDTIDLTIADYGWTNKTFEVAAWQLLISDTGGVRIRMTLRETSESAFSWSASDEQAIISNNSTLPKYYQALAPGVSLSGDLRLVNEQVVGALLIDVTSGSDQTDQFDVQYRKTGDTEWIALGRSTSNRFEAVGISDGSFDVRARSINSLGVRSPWTTVSSFYITLFATPPADVTNFSANVVGNTLHLSWSPVPDLDLSHYKIRYSSETSGAEYQRSIDLVAKVSRPANTVSVPAQTGTYFIKAVDKLGKLSASPASIVISTNTVDIENLNVVQTSIQHPSFTGSKPNVVLDSDGAGNFITIDPVALPSSGTYEFDTYVDLGQKYVSRVQTSLLMGFLDYVNDFDSAEDLFDAREGLFDGDPSQFDTTTVRTQVSFTDDDPAGTPTWSTWRDFVVGDIDARAFRFRAILETQNAGNAPLVRQLSATVDMPDRVESESDITYTGSQTVTFPSAFKAVPAIGIAASLADGDRYVISGKSRTGFTITTYTGGSVSTNSTTFDYVAKGYGKELT